MVLKCDLSELVDNYQILLLDNSATQKMSSQDNKPYLNVNLAHQHIKILAEEDCEYINFIKDLIEYDLPIYVTSGVLKQIMVPSNKSDTKRIKSASARYNRSALEFFRALKTKKLAKLRLARILEEKDRVVVLNDLEKTNYQIFSDMIDDNPHKISEVNMEFLLTGAALVSNSRSVALLSNDFGILRSWKIILDNSYLEFVNFGFFIREGVDSFEGAKYRRKLKN